MTYQDRSGRLFLITLVCVLTACQSAAKKDEAPPPSFPDEVSLKADRSQFDEIRSEIPDEIKRENDELAFVRSLMADGETEPSSVRERYQKAVRDRRDKFNKTHRKLRDEFSRKERAERDAFLKGLKSEREEFMKRAKSKKLSSEERREFFDEIEARRRDFFNDQRDNRQTFESETTDQRRAFESYISERNQVFNQEIREYTTRYNERRKALEMKKKMEREADRSGASSLAAPPYLKGAVNNDPDLEDFKSIPPGPGSPLGPDKNN